MFDTTKPRTVSVFFAGVIGVGAEISVRRDELSVFCLFVLLNQSVYPNVHRKSVYRPSRLSNILHYLGLPIIPFRIENGISFLIDPSKKSSRFKNASVLQTDVTISSPHLGFGIQKTPEEKCEKPLPGRTTSECPVKK